MTTIPTSRSEDRISVRAEQSDASHDPSKGPRASDPMPGPGAVFVVLGALLVGLAAAFVFQKIAPDTPLVILGGTLIVAAILGFVGLFRYEWFLLITLAVRPALDDLIADEFGTFQPSAILGILAIGVSFLHLISRRLTGNWTPMTPLGWAFIAFFVGFLPSFVTSVDRGVSQAALFGLASVVLLYLAIEQHLLEDGTYLVFVVLIAISIIPTVEVKHKLVVLGAACLGGFLLIATFARGAWASFLIGALVMAARINRKLVVLIAGGAVAVSAVVPGVRDRIDNLFATTGANGGAKTDDSLGWRIGYWDEIWGRFGTRNPLTGIGIDATKTQTLAAKDPHNSFLQAYLEGGIIGATGFLLVLGLGGYAGYKTLGKARRGQLDYRTKLISVGAIAGLLSVAAQLITENVLLNTIVWWYLNIAFAYLAVLTWGDRNKKAAEEEPDYSQLALPAGNLGRRASDVSS